MMETLIGLWIGAERGILIELLSRVESRRWISGDLWVEHWFIGGR
jgi:hypothetical protein